MNRGFLLIVTGFISAISTLRAQQVSDTSYQPGIGDPAYGSGQGPRVGIDEAHHNFHTAGGRYQPFANLLRRDGYQVGGFTRSLSADALREVDLLVIANPVNERNAKDWSLPTPSAFTKEEIAALHDWVEKGGSLLLIADHMPFPGGAGELAESFGAVFSNGYARTGRPQQERGPDVFRTGEGLAENFITKGRSEDEKVTQVATFGGSAFRLPEGATPILTFSTGSISRETRKAPGITPDAPVVRIEGWSQGAVLTLGKGRVAIFGEASMFSAQLSGPEKKPMGMNAPKAEQNHRLVLNLLHWLSRAGEAGR
ncbi:hypothetical protein JIN84_20500 [Luteolibacter yonseiensis]|uniref:DUF4350 domain-containing protein n=1 Tax=Luteolibacter yonseiensis TaxID=1144680 RepID=A0A934VDD0_9BACT|nr:DUF4350 domain-containing protein [Luteolibacter yonseiensis]MBK1818015.1 hypothetical protein [Luteolibacter yonseiensis]